MLKGWAEYASMAYSRYEAYGIIPVMTEFGPEMQEITLDLMTKAVSDGKKQVKFLFDSWGGSASACIAIRNALFLFKLFDPKLESLGLVFGKAYSSAFFLLQACDKRIAVEGSTLLLHWGNSTWGNDERAAVMRNEAWPTTHLKEYNNSMIRIVSERTGVSQKKLRKYADRNRLFTSQEALRRNFLDHVIQVGKPEIDKEVLGILAGLSA